MLNDIYIWDVISSHMYWYLYSPEEFFRVDVIKEGWLMKELILIFLKMIGKLNKCRSTDPPIDLWAIQLKPAF